MINEHIVAFLEIAGRGRRLAAEYQVGEDMPDGELDLADEGVADFALSAAKVLALWYIEYVEGALHSFIVLAFQTTPVLNLLLNIPI